MEHKQYKRIIPGAQTAVLFLHGIAGSPNHFLPFLPLVPDTVSIYNLLLDGHGQNARAFAKTSMKKWEAQVQQAVDELSQSHDAIYIAAHSMGSLFAIAQAVKNKKVARLFLLAAPIKLSVKPRALTNSLSLYRNHAAPAAQACCSIALDKNPLHYLGWIPRYLELFAKIRQTHALLPALSTPCAVYQSAKDELVSIRSVQLLQRVPAVSVSTLKNSTHYCYEKNDLDFLLEEFSRFLQSAANL